MKIDNESRSDSLESSRAGHERLVTWELSQEDGLRMTSWSTPELAPAVRNGSFPPFPAHFTAAAGQSFVFMGVWVEQLVAAGCERR